MTNAKAELVRSWLTKARHDLASARVLAASELALLDTAIYHCQQVPSCKTRFAAEVMVGEGVSPMRVNRRQAACEKCQTCSPASPAGA